jgi:putative peptidoglycan lipid II flippase
MSAVSSIAAPSRNFSINRAIFRAAASVGVAGIFVKILATFKEVAVASVYGRSDSMDAFLAAALIPSLLVNLISESMNQALVPTLVRVREQEGHERAQQLLSSSMLWMCLLLAAASAVLALAARGFFPLIASRFAPAKLNLAVHLFYALLPVVLITGIATNCTAALNTVDRFAVPALAPMAISFAIIAGALFFGSRFGIWAMVGSTLIGSLLHAGLVAAMMHRRGYRFRLRWYGMDEPMREVAGQYGPVLLSSVVSSGGLLVDQAMAAMLIAGSVSALVYANRFVSVVLTLLAGAISTAIVPYLSRMIAFHDWNGCRQTIRTWVRLTALVSLPIAILLIAAARPLVRAALQHGQFGPRDTAVVAPVLAMYAIQIPFFVVSRVYYRFVVAMRRTDLILYCGILNLGLDIVLNVVLMRRFGVAGIALATSLWTVSTFFYLWYWSGKLLGRASAAEANA